MIKNFIKKLIYFSLIGILCLILAIYLYSKYHDSKRLDKFLEENLGDKKSAYVTKIDELPAPLLAPTSMEIHIFKIKNNKEINCSLFQNKNTFNPFYDIEKKYFDIEKKSCKKVIFFGRANSLTFAIQDNILLLKIIID